MVFSASWAYRQIQLTNVDGFTWFLHAVYNCGEYWLMVVDSNFGCIFDQKSLSNYGFKETRHKCSCFGEPRPPNITERHDAVAGDSPTLAHVPWGETDA